MRVYRDECHRQTLFALTDRETFLPAEQIMRTVSNEIIDYFTREGIRRLTRPRAIPVKSSTCWIPRHKLRK